MHKLSVFIIRPIRYIEIKFIQSRTPPFDQRSQARESICFDYYLCPIYLVLVLCLSCLFHSAHNESKFISLDAILYKTDVKLTDPRFNSSKWHVEWYLIEADNNVFLLTFVIVSTVIGA